MNTLRTTTFLAICFLICLTFTHCEIDPVPIDLCNNNKADEGEIGIDCGGTCPDCHEIDSFKELLIRDTFIVNSDAAKTGALSFGHLINNIAPSEDLSKDLVLSLFNSWENESLIINGVKVESRKRVRDLILKPWKSRDGQAGVTDADWNMNLNNAPFKLLAITNRVDLKDSDDDIESAGEGRLTYSVEVGNNQFTWIFEYNLPATSQEDIRMWAKKWHHLSSFNNFSESYRTALIGVVNGFTKKNSMPSRVNGSAINQIRTNEIAIGSPWELREFNLDSLTKLFKEVTRKMTPDIRHNKSDLLEMYIDSFQNEIIAGKAIPDSFNGEPFLAGNVPTPTAQFVWELPSGSTLGNPAALKKLSLFSCNGCHGGSTNTSFTHIKPRGNEESRLSRFLEFTDIPIRHDTILSVLQLPFDPISATAALAVVTEQDSAAFISVSKIEEIRELLKSTKNRVH